MPSATSAKKTAYISLRTRRAIKCVRQQRPQACLDQRKDIVMNLNPPPHPAVAAQAKLAVKDHYTFDFLSLGDAHEERELEAGLIAQIRSFLTGMGPNFTFVGSQQE